jgi:phosphoglycolate phosphatase-like HAD superfamily hydrolase
MTLTFPLKRACLFDFDGTLVDTMHQLADIAMHIIHQMQPCISAALARQLYLETSGIPFWQQLEQIMPDHPMNETAASLFEHEKAWVIRRHGVPQATQRTLQRLRQAERIIAISSNNVQSLVDTYVIENQLSVDMVLAWQPNLYKGKPHFDAIAHRYDLTYDQMVFIGDSLTDATLAQQYGIDFIAKTGTFSRQVFLDRFPHIPVIDSLEEVLKFVVHPA